MTFSRLMIMVDLMIPIQQLMAEIVCELNREKLENHNLPFFASFRALVSFRGHSQGAPLLVVARLQIKGSS